MDYFYNMHILGESSFGTVVCISEFASQRVEHPFTSVLYGLYFCAIQQQSNLHVYRSPPTFSHFSTNIHPLFAVCTNFCWLSPRCVFLPSRITSKFTYILSLRWVFYFWSNTCPLLVILNKICSWLGPEWALHIHCWGLLMWSVLLCNCCLPMW